MTPSEYLTQISHRLNPKQMNFVEYLVRRNHNNTEAHAEIIAFMKTIYNGHASPLIYGKPQILSISPEGARRILRRTRLWPRQSPPDQVKIREFADLIRRGEWTPDPKQPIMVSKSAVLINGRHRLRSIIRAGEPALMPILNELRGLEL